MSGDTIVTIDELRKLIKSNPDELTIEKVFGKDAADKYYQQRRELDAIYASVDAERAREKEWAEKWKREAEAKDEPPKDPDPHDPDVNPLLGGKAFEEQQKKDPLPNHLNPAKNPMIKIG